ncbi:MAG: hypothetical protein ACW981_05055 [Candidatus Hodarchaeales archaeon]|jgi:hypothetical protein
MLKDADNNLNLFNIPFPVLIILVGSLLVFLIGLMFAGALGSPESYLRF